MIKQIKNNYSKIYLPLLMLILFAIAFSSCQTDGSNGSVTQGSREFTDDLGTKVNLPEDVKKVVSLAPNLTEIIYAIEAGDKLVGVTSFCNYPEEATKVKKVGDTLKPNIENIVALKPDVVFVSTASQLEAFSKTLEAQGTQVFVTNPQSIRGIYKSIETIGEILGKKDKSKEVVSNMKKRITEIEEKTKDAKLITTFIQISKDLYTIGKTAYLTDLVRSAGGVSVTNDVPMDFPKITKERAIELNPETIILSDSPDNDEPNDAFNNSDAVINKRIYKVNADILSRPGPRIVDALEEIAKSLHPDQFK